MTQEKTPANQGDSGGVEEIHPSVLEASRRAKLDRYRNEMGVDPFGGRVFGLVSLGAARAAVHEPGHGEERVRRSELDFERPRRAMLDRRVAGRRQHRQRLVDLGQAFVGIAHLLPRQHRRACLHRRRRAGVDHQHRVGRVGGEQRIEGVGGLVDGRFVARQCGVEGLECGSSGWGGLHDGGRGGRADHVLRQCGQCDSCVSLHELGDGGDDDPAGD